MDDVTANKEVNKATGALPGTARVAVSYTHLTLPTNPEV